MCFHLAISQTAQKLENRYNAQFDEEFVPIYHSNGFSFPNYPVISSGEQEKIQFYNWGLIPEWAKDKDIRSKTLNARSETVFEKPSFRQSIRSKRCLVPATGFYENQTVGKIKQPYHISIKSEEIFSLAGIWAEWLDKETGELKRTFSILTTDANPMMAEIHNLKKRMPVILNRENENLWLDTSLKKEELEKLILAYPEDDMMAFKVSRDLNKRTVNTNESWILEGDGTLF